MVKVKWWLGTPRDRHEKWLAGSQVLSRAIASGGIPSFGPVYANGTGVAVIWRGRYYPIRYGIATDDIGWLDKAAPKPKT